MTCVYFTLSLLLPPIQAHAIFLLSCKNGVLKWSTHIYSQPNCPQNTSLATLIKTLHWFPLALRINTKLAYQTCMIGLLFTFSMPFCVSPLTSYTPSQPLWISFSSSNALCFSPLKIFEYALPFVWNTLLTTLLPPQLYSFCYVSAQIQVSLNIRLHHIPLMLFSSLQSFFVAVMFCKYLHVWMVLLTYISYTDWNRMFLVVEGTKTLHRTHGIIKHARTVGI